MNSNMMVKVEFLAGTDIKHAIQEAKEKAASWNVAYVQFRFNGTDFSIGANADIEAAINEYKCSMTRGKSHGVCSA